MNEPKLKSYMLDCFGKDFIVREEVAGNFIVDNTPVIIDYLMYPSEDLIDRGFEKQWFGVEVKVPGSDAKKGLQVSWQAITYSQSLFDGIRPVFVLIFPQITDFFRTPSDAYYVKTLLQKANVGYVEVNERSKTWKIMFGANVYFYSDRGLSKTPTIATKRNVGSWK
ncbi:hypothetical protein [Candidatus Electrothrix sp.]|uniref:hypothetical protein n=1 Tax=Candidatus Electrothrix sp. TaxID=2170559 RepID=UPI004055AB55